MLLTVLVITAVGLLFGAGALLLFRYQCQMRIDRQHELEKMYAVRSALNYIKEKSVVIPEAGESFHYHTGSERDLELFVKPVADIFPIVTNTRHFVMERCDFDVSLATKGWHRSYPDYECGWESPTNLTMDISHAGLAFADRTSPKGSKWWVNIGMADTGGWLQEEYGRRYYFSPEHYAGADSAHAGDIVRLCIIRAGTNVENAVGRQYGWPLSKDGERAIVFQVRELRAESDKNKNNALMSIFEYVYSDGSIQQTPILTPQECSCPSRHRMGLQISEDKVSAFYIENAAAEIESTQKPRGGYTFSKVGQLSLGTYKYFANGLYTNLIDGKVHAPDLRAVFEVEAASENRVDGPSGLSYLAASDSTQLTRFRVTPAYQFDVFLVYPTSVTNRATIAQKIGSTGRGKPGYTVLTYDTHGTDNKGFRKDEKEWVEKKGGGS